MGERRNFYRILGVQPDATAEVIRGSYRTLMQKLQMHPDLGGDVRTAAMINAAWRTLQDPQRRAAYDQQLLSEYDIRMIASGGDPVVANAGHGSADRRNYYRILGVQHDAPPALIDSAYRIMRGVAAENELLLAEAYAVLSNPQRRLEYDAVLAGEAVAEPAAAEPDVPDYVPLISRFCYFCKTPHSDYPGCVTQDSCNECDSPLQRPESVGSGLQRRFERTETAAEATVFDYWPGRGWRALLEDFTPDGLRLFSQHPLEHNQVIRVQATGLDAVARVVHCQTVTSGCRAGTTLLAAAFSDGGVLLDLQS